MKFAASLSLFISSWLFLVPRNVQGGSLRGPVILEADPKHDTKTIEGEAQQRELNGNPYRDIIFMIDGSDAVGKSEWYVERSGIAAAIEDPNVVPRDGTVAIAVVQYAATEKIEVPYIVVTSQADVDKILRVVNNMVPLGTQSFPGLAIQTAHEHVQVNARQKARQVFCMAAGSVGYPGTVPLDQAVKDAKRSGYKLDMYSVVAIGGGGTPDEDFRKHYEPLLIDGKLEIAKTSKGFRESIEVACFGLSIEITDIKYPKQNDEYGEHDMIPLEADIADKQPYDQVLWFVDNTFATTGKSTSIYAGNYKPNAAHTVACAVTLNSKTVASDITTIYIRGTPNTLPQVEINKPNRGQTFQTVQVIEFNAYASDKEDGVLNGSSLKWYSSKNGFIGQGSVVQKNAIELQVGRHFVSIVAEDSSGGIHTETTVIKVTQGPLVSVMQPVQDTAFYGETMELIATATESMGGKIPDEKIVWTSSRDGEIGRGLHASVSTRLLTGGEHEITCTATDGRGKRGADSVIILIVETENSN